MDLLQELLALEERLLALGQSCDPACVEALLAPGFIEFGASGRVWTRDAILKELRSVGVRSYTLSSAACGELCPGTALLTYRVTVNGRTSLRSSVWVRGTEGWQMVFHQGTPVPGETPG